jgi:pSer/pThr/pTyr-binding forkhead associated (FHA) protein
MIPGFGKQRITIGSDEHCDVRLSGSGILPEHASIVHEGNGRLTFVDGGQGTSNVDGTPLPPGGSASFDFRAQFSVADALVPLTHPAIALMLLKRGEKASSAGQLVLGRDPARVDIVIQHPNISGFHATVSFDPFTITDHGSKSGTWIGRKRLAPEETHPLEVSALVALGPVPFTSSLLRQLKKAIEPAAPLQEAPKAVGNAPGGFPRRAHKTIVGQISMAVATQPETKTIGRTPENDIQVNHAQVSSKHAFLHKQGDQLFVEDRGSANGTFVRGKRITPG